MISSTPEAANAFGFMFIFPLTFISSAFVPVESMPAALEAFAEGQPLHHGGGRDAPPVAGSSGANSDVWVAFLWTIAITVVFFFIATAKYQRARQRSSRT